MVHRETQALLLFLLVAIPIAGLGHYVAAESYALSPSPPRTQETDTPGVTLSLSVSGATSGQPYSFTWVVADPAGTNRTASRSTVATSSFVLSVNYPFDFVGSPHIQYVGRYVVNVAQTSPSVNPSVALGAFDAGLTDSPTYQRTSPVYIRASEYPADENVTVDLRFGSNSVPGYPKLVTADSNGEVFDNWATGPSTPTGNYTVTLTGFGPPKNPPDTQTFILYGANVTISQILMPVSSLSKTETAEFAFSANYLGGGSVQTGSAVVRVAEPDQTSHFVTATWNSSFFVARYRIPLDSQTGIWVATIDVNNFDDGFGNEGPLVSPVKGFGISPALLTVSVNVLNGTRTVHDIIIVSARVTSPDGNSFSQGNVTAQFVLSGRPVGNQISLTYDQSQSQWIGSYIVREDDESGAWVVQVSASDSYANSGLGSASLVVSIPSQNPITSWWFLSILAALVAAILLALFFFKKKLILRRQIQVDLRAVGREVDRVKNQDFFKKIQEQLNVKKLDSKEKDNG